MIWVCHVCLGFLAGNYSKTCLKQPLKKDQKLFFKTALSLNACQKYCRKHSAVLSTFIKLPFVFKTFVLSPLKPGFTVVFEILELCLLDLMC